MRSLWQKQRPCLEELESRLALSTLTTSTNWSGYAVTTNTGAVTTVSGSWTVPTASGPSTGYSASWVGIDGFNSSTVEQIGTESDYVSGQAQYYAWWEMYPGPSVNLALTVNPGDSITASVTFVSSSGRSSSYKLSITDNTTNHTFTTTQSIRGAQQSSAEWVVEAPSSGGILPLANFGTETFSGASATISSVKGAIDSTAWTQANAQVQQINMTNNAGVQQDSTSSLTDTTSGGATTSGFTVTASPTTTPTGGGGHHHRWWWFQPDNSGTASSGTGTLTGNTVAINPSQVNSLATPGLQGGTPNFLQQPAVQSPLAVTPSVGSLPSNPSVLANAARSVLSGTSSPLQAGQPAPQAEAAPNPNETPIPGQEPAPEINPDTAPAAMTPADFEKAAGLPHGVADSPAAGVASPVSGAVGMENNAFHRQTQPLVSTAEEFHSPAKVQAALLLALACAGFWHVPTEEETRRRLLKTF